MRSTMPAHQQHASLRIDYSKLEGMASEALSSGIALRQLSPTMAAAAIRGSDEPSLYLRMTKPIEQIGLMLPRLPELLQRLAIGSAEDNRLWVSTLKMQYLPGATPILWSNFPADLVDLIFREQVAVIIFYNPARFADRLRSAGFEVELSADAAKVQLSYIHNNIKIKVENEGYFLSLIQDYLVDELSVADWLTNLVKGVDSRQLAPGTAIRFLPVQKKPDN